VFGRRDRGTEWLRRVLRGRAFAGCRSSERKSSRYESGKGNRRGGAQLRWQGTRRRLDAAGSACLLTVLSCKDIRISSCWGLDRSRIVTLLELTGRDFEVGMCLLCFHSSTISSSALC